jgi:hypothetical protein
MAKPPAETQLSAALVRDLIQAQHRQFAHLPVIAGTSGWDNDIFRLNVLRAADPDHLEAGLQTLRRLRDGP